MSNVNLEKMKKGESYHIDEGMFRLQSQCAKKLNKINHLPFGSKKREALLTSLFKRIGQRNIIKENFHCNYGFNISIGDDCFLNFDCTILDSYEVEIGNRVFIAPKVLISPVTHPLEAKKRKDLIIKKIIIEDDVWIGAGAIILPGVTIHHGAVIGANAVVNQDVEANTVVGGIPAHFIKTINNK